MGYFGRLILGYGILPNPLIKPQICKECTCTREKIIKIMKGH